MCLYSLKAEFTWSVAGNQVLKPHLLVEAVMCNLLPHLSPCFSCNILRSGSAIYGTEVLLVCLKL